MYQGQQHDHNTKNGQVVIILRTENLRVRCCSAETAVVEYYRWDWSKQKSHWFRYFRFIPGRRTKQQASVNRLQSSERGSYVTPLRLGRWKIDDEKGRLRHRPVLLISTVGHDITWCPSDNNAKINRLVRGGRSRYWWTLENIAIVVSVVAIL